MTADDRWLLPDGVEEILPGDAWRMERVRRDLLDLFHAWGYDLVMPPLIEYLDALLTGVGRDQELQTFKLTDAPTGRLLGVRADQTPQVARIEAHFLRTLAPVRLCYIGPTLRARADEPHEGRELMQVGAELFGSASPMADVEIVQIMVESLRICGIDTPHLDLGHVGVFRGLAREAELDAAREGDLFEAMQRKSRPDVAALLERFGLPDSLRRRFAALVELDGDREVLDRLRERLRGSDTGVLNALDNLAEVAAGLARVLPELPQYFDLAELRGYRYHTGVVFSAFARGFGRAVALGGRYDDIGRAFGHPRPATGFSADLRRLMRDVNGSGQPVLRGIAAPALDDPALREAAAALRAGGERIIHVLPGQDPVRLAQTCDRELFHDGDRWVVRPLGNKESRTS